VRCFMPEGCPKIEAISITLEELETVRLVDLLDLDQEDAAFYMGISRKAFWNDLMNARKKIAAALVYGVGLRIEGGSFALRGGEGSSDMEDQSRQREMELMERELALLRSRLEHLGARLAAAKGLDKTNSDARSGIDL
jgi:predicted DNA-binding protein (UPF0251 family)